MSEPMQWLKAHHRLDIEADELDAIRDFSLLWGVFESVAMATRGSQREVVAAAERMNIAAQLPDEFEEPLAFWRARYWYDGSTTSEFDRLGFAQNSYRTAVMLILSADNGSPLQTVTALLQIVLRLRNNLFHGVKWQYRLHDQFQNFNHANAVLMASIELSPPPP